MTATRFVCCVRWPRPPLNIQNKIMEELLPPAAATADELTQRYGAPDGPQILGSSTNCGVDESTGDQTEKHSPEYAGLHCEPRKPDFLAAAHTCEPRAEIPPEQKTGEIERPGLHCGPALDPDEFHPSPLGTRSTTLHSAEQAAAAAMVI